jgi:uncharacterized protein involved in exopolysaccharide biosynthesis
LEDRSLLPVFFPEIGGAEGGASGAQSHSERLDLRDGVSFFHKRVLEVSQEKGTGLVILAVEWKSPEEAADWANDLVDRLNSRLREEAVTVAEKNVAYLQLELGQTNIVALQQSIVQLLEQELQKLMLARGDAEFAFRVVDPARPPKHPVRPRRKLIIVIGAVVGIFVGIFVVLLRFVVRGGVLKAT